MNNERYIHYHGNGKLYLVYQPVFLWDGERWVKGDLDDPAGRAFTGEDEAQKASRYIQADIRRGTPLTRGEGR